MWQSLSFISPIRKCVFITYIRDTYWQTFQCKNRWLWKVVNMLCCVADNTLCLIWRICTISPIRECVKVEHVDAQGLSQNTNDADANYIHQESSFDLYYLMCFLNIDFSKIELIYTNHLEGFHFGDAEDDCVGWRRDGQHKSVRTGHSGRQHKINWVDSNGYALFQEI